MLKISTYQIVNYFLSGFVVLFAYWIATQSDLKNLNETFNKLRGYDDKIILSAFIFIVSCLIGIVINAFRNLVIEILIFGKSGRENKKEREIRKSFKPKDYKYTTINFDAFYKSDNAYLERVESSFYIFYSGAVNLALSLTISWGLFYQQSVYWQCSLFICDLILFLYAFWPLRQKMIKATWFDIYTDVEAGDIRDYSGRLILVFGAFIVVYISSLFFSPLPEKGKSFQFIHSTKVDSVYIYPFIAGTNSLEKNTYIENSLGKLKNIAADSSVTVVYIFSSVDIQELKGKARSRYKENINLAQARGDTIKTIIEKLLPSPKAPIFIIPQGASYFGNNTIVFKQNRSVVVCFHKTKCDIISCNLKK